MKMKDIFTKSIFTFKEQSIYNFISKLIKIGIVVLIMYLIIKIGNTLLKRWVKRQKKMKFSLDERKAKTIGVLLKSLLRYSVYFFGITGIVQIIFGNIGLTFAGIGGVAIGFGAQGIIKDIINGFFILFEDQFGIGDYIDIQDMSGIVESVELRITKIRDFNGDLHIVPNSLISKVTNHSRGNSRIMVEVDIAYEENIDKAIEVINGICCKFKDENDYVVDGPRVLGVSALKDSSVTIRIMGKVKPLMQWDGEMKLRKEIKNGLDSANIEIPYPKLKIIKEE